MYIVYLLLYILISYKTDFGFKYTNGFELLWGSIIAALITTAMDAIIFRLSYRWTGFLSKLYDYNAHERKTAHWKFRMIFSIPVLLFALSPLCSMCMTPLIHCSYVWLSVQYNNIIKQITAVLIPK